MPPDEAKRVRECIDRLVSRFESDSELARVLGVSQAAISKWRAGLSSPGLPQLEEIARHLDTTEYRMRKGAVADLETALHYHGHGKWSDRVVRQARDLADDMTARGESMSPQSWTDKLNDLAKRAPRE